MHPSLVVYNNEIDNLISKDFEIQTLDNDCLFTEGPVWNSEGFYLFSDIPANCIYKIDEGKNKELFLSNSGTANPKAPDLKPDQIGSNALAYDVDGNLLICQHGSHAIAKYDGKTLHPYIDSYLGRPFNSPNDFVLHNNGTLYFSDPPYGLKDGNLMPQKFQPLAGVYACNKGQLKMITDKYRYPNGVCLSNDHGLLFICSNKPFEKFISVYDTLNHQFIKVFAEENSDGIEVDKYNNVYLCNKDGIIILDQKGDRLALIQLPAVPANICWGGPNLNHLFITARESIFLIKDLQK